MAGPAPRTPRTTSTDGRSDEDLAREVQRGDGEALDRLVRRYLRPIHAVMGSYLAERADVEDAVQDAFLRAIDGIGSYRASRPFAPWLYQVARNVARDRLRATVAARLDPLPASDVGSAAPGPDVQAERAEMRRLVAAAIDRLPEQRRTAFRLHDVDGYAPEETARIMGLSTGTVRSHVHHARRALRGALASRLGDAADG